MTEPIECPPTGIYQGVSFGDYKQWDAMNMSTLLEGDVSMEHLKAALDGKLTKTSDALSFGRAFHARILEPEFYKSQWVTATTCCGTTNPGKKNEGTCSYGGNRIDADGKWFCKTHGKGLEPPDEWVTEDEARRIEEIASKLKGHAAVTLLRAKGGFETSIVWEYRGVKFKGRLDKFIRGTNRGDIILDPKKVRLRHGGFDKFGYSIKEYGYHIRAASYVIGAKTITSVAPSFIWVAIEDTYPYSIGLYELGEEEFAVGKYHLDRLIDGYKIGMESGNWPGYSDTVHHARLPGWYMKTNIDEIEKIAQAEG